MTTQSPKALHKAAVEDIKQRLVNFLEVAVVIEFGDHELATVILDVIPTRLLDVRKNTPEQRTDADGRTYTPPMVTIKCSDGELVFLIEDIVSVRTTTTCALIDFKEYAVRIKRI